MSTLIKDAGVWKEPEMIYVKDQGVWKEVGGGVKIPAIGEPMEGGFFFGLSVVDSDLYLLIIADKAAESLLRWKTAHTSTAGTSSAVDGWANTNAMNNTAHPAAKYCRDYRGGSFDDWYLPARDELNQAWLNIPPGGTSTPAIFKAGGAQALTTPTYYWSSTETSAVVAMVQRFSDGDQTGYSKMNSYLVRPVRRLKV